MSQGAKKGQDYIPYNKSILTRIIAQQLNCSNFCFSRIILNNQLKCTWINLSTHKGTLMDYLLSLIRSMVRQGSRKRKFLGNKL